MGLYAVECYVCGAAHMWWSGNMDQRCETCKLENKYIREDGVERKDPNLIEDDQKDDD